MKKEDLVNVMRISTLDKTLAVMEKYAREGAWEFTFNAMDQWTGDRLLELGYVLEPTDKDGVIVKWGEYIKFKSGKTEEVSIKMTNFDEIIYAYNLSGGKWTCLDLRENPQSDDLMKYAEQLTEKLNTYKKESGEYWMDYFFRVKSL